MDIAAKKDELKIAVGENLGQGLQEVLTTLNTKSETITEILTQQGRYNDNERKQRDKVISHNDYTRETNQIRLAALNLIGMLTKDDLQNLDSRLKDIIRDLNIKKDKVGPLYLINCDRQASADKHWNRFDNKIALGNVQFYFIPACPHQMPPSFAERMVWELLLEELEEVEEEALSYETKGNGGRMKPADFKIGRNTDRTQKNLKKYFCKRFKTDSFEQLIEERIENLGYEYIASLFTIEIDEWRDFMPEFLNWMVEIFHRKDKKDAPHFLFYIVVYMNGFVLEPQGDRQKSILKDIKQIIDNKSNHCTILDGFEAIGDDDIERWFRKIGEWNPLIVREAVNELVNNLSLAERERYKVHKRIDMARVEHLQRMVYEIVGE